MSIDNVSCRWYLISTAPPGQPRTVAVESVGATWVLICWDSPFTAESPISHYEITARPANADIAMVTVTTASNNTFSNVTGLLPGTTYELTVVAVSQGGDVIARSQESDPVQGIITGVTGVYPKYIVCECAEGVKVNCSCLFHSSSTNTVPALVCSVPVSARGDIIVMWSYIHTGGLPLTNVSMVYIFNESMGTITNPVSISGVDTTSVEVADLVAGFEYLFNTTAENSNGASSILCGPIHHIVGKSKLVVVDSDLHMHMWSKTISFMLIRSPFHAYVWGGDVWS